MKKALRWTDRILAVIGFTIFFILAPCLPVWPVWLD